MSMQWLLCLDRRYLHVYAAVAIVDERYLHVDPAVAIFWASNVCTVMQRLLIFGQAILAFVCSGCDFGACDTCMFM